MDHVLRLTPRQDGWDGIHLLAQENEEPPELEPTYTSTDIFYEIDNEPAPIDISPATDENLTELPKEEAFGIKAVAQKLFAPDQTTSQATESFENLFKGNAVTWSGTLVNVRSYRFDLVFGDMPGTRAEFDVLDPGDSPITGRIVKAIVQFPPELEEPLRALVDDFLVFQGTLVSCDVFMRNLFLTDGNISEAGT